MLDLTSLYHLLLIVSKARTPSLFRFSSYSNNKLNINVFHLLLQKYVHCYNFPLTSYLELLYFINGRVINCICHSKIYVTAHQNGRFEKTFSATFTNNGAVVKNHYNHHNSPVLQWTWLSKSYSKINVRSSSDDHLIPKYIKYLGCCFYLHSFDFSTTIRD